jgi:hypothetical protein
MMTIGHGWHSRTWLNKENAPTGLPAGRCFQASVVAKLPAQLHGLALSNVGEKGNLASAVDLQGKGALVFCAQARCSLGKNLPQTIHELL